MPLVDAKCPLCGKEIRVPDDIEYCYCPDCGNRIISKAAIAFADNKPTASTAALETRPESISSSPETPAPFLDNWKTQGGLVALGIIVSTALGSFATRIIVVSTDWNTLVIATVTSLGLLLASLIFCLLVYPSCFGNEPLTRSNSTISFLNGFVGGLLFGPIWCSNLTNRKKGISYILLPVLFAVVVFFVFIVLLSGNYY